MNVAPHHSIEELQRLAKNQTQVRSHIRFQALLLAKRGYTAKAIAQTLDVPQRTVESWIHRYNEKSDAGLIDGARSGRKCRLSTTQKAQFKARIDGGATAADGVCSLRGVDFQRILKEEFNVCYSLNGVYHLLHQFGYSSLVPRPRHQQADPVAQEAFKKD